MEEALRDLAPRWQRYWPDADVERIVIDVRERMSAALDAWSLDEPEPLEGGVGSLTCAAGDVVVKVLPRHHPEEQAMRGEAEALALVEAGRLIKRLHAAGPPPESLPGVEVYTEPYRQLADPELADLIATTERGDPHLDIWLLLCPQAPALPHDDPVGELRRRIGVYCDAAGLDPERAELWVGVVARAEARLSHDSAFEWWPERLRQIGAALSRG
jgi:hypothetical protein